MRSGKARIYPVVGALVGTFGAWPAAAQTPAPPTSAPSSADIIVTAQRRAERLEDVPMSVTAVYISLADHILYPAYAAAPRISSLTPMQDQQLGGLIMWVPGGLFFGVIMTFVFFKWAASGSDDRASAQVDAPLRPVGAARERPLR